jgi:DNA-binding beta-propeller fold protein YncE
VAAPCKVVATISLPANADPVAAAFSPQNDRIYVVDNYLNQVYVIAKTKVVATISGGFFSYPDAISWDPGDGIMLVANFGASNITAISGTSYAGSIAVGSQPDSIAYDPYYDTILIDNFGSSNITILPSATFPFATTHANTTYGGGGEQIVYSPAYDDDYVAGFGLGSVVVINGLGGYLGSIPVGKGPISLAFDQSSLNVFVVNRYSHSVWSLSGLTVFKKFTLAKGTQPLALCYSDFTTQMYVTVTYPTSELLELN